MATRFIWTAQRVKSLDPKYKAKVLLNTMDGRTHGAIVKFGNMGKGSMPNYQVEYTNGQIFTFSGRSHQRLKVPFFNPDNLSPAISLNELL